MLPAFFAAFQFLAGPRSSENWEEDRDDVRFFARLRPRALQARRISFWDPFRRGQPVFGQNPFPSVRRKPTRSIWSRIRVRVRRFRVAEKSSSGDVLVVRLARRGRLAMAFFTSEELNLKKSFFLWVLEIQPVCCRGSEVADLLFVDVDVVQRVASCERGLQIEPVL